MENLEQLKVQVEKDYLVRKELEEYVSDLELEYMEKADYRRTKLFREIENIYTSFPSIQSIAENYSTCFVMLDGNYSGKKSKAAREVIANIYRHFPDSVYIAQNYVFLLMMCADGLDSIECKKIVEIVEEICVRFSDSNEINEIKENLEQIKESYKAAVEYERLSSEVELLAQKVSDVPDSKELISEYVNVLAEYAAYVDEEECDKIRNIASGYCEQFPDNVEFKKKYAEINVFLMKQVDEKRAGRLLIEVQSIYNENSLVELAITYAEALCEIACLQNSKHRISVKELRNLYDKYPDVPQIVAAFACGLYTLVDVQGERAAKKTLLEMFSLAEKYPDNADIYDYLEDAKNDFAFDHEDAVFWKTKKAQNINTNCFAVLDIETTWDGKVMTIGVVIADKVTYQPERFKYYIITPEYQEGGMYSMVIPLPNEEISKTCSRGEAIRDLCECFKVHGVDSIYAYNMSFDRNKVPELEDYSWFDIMVIASNRHYNKCIPSDAECHNNGRLKRNYGAEPIMHMLSGNYNYHKLHNALFDAMDELKIMQYLRYSLESYCLNAVPVGNLECISPSDMNENEFKVGDRLYHKVFGHGLVLERLSDMHTKYGSHSAVVVSFIRVGTKQIMAPFRDIVCKEV